MYSTGSVSRTLGVLAATAGRLEQAEQHLARAVAVNEEVGALCQLARSHLDYGLLLQQVRRPDDAAEHVAAGRKLAERLGMPASWNPGGTAEN